MHKRQHAFTLIELLVVISIIALLIAILLPALGAARKSAQITMCGANLQQIGVGALSYAPDNKGALPPAVGAKPTYIRSGNLDVREELDGYIEFNLLQCPLAPEQIDLNNIVNAKPIIETNYGFYWNWEWTDQDGTKKMTDIDKTFSRKFGPGGSIELEFNVLAMDYDTRGSFRFESSHPSRGAFASVRHNDPSSTGSNAWSRWETDGPTRENIDKNYLFNDGSVTTFGDVDHTHRNVSGMRQVPSFSSGGASWVVYMPDINSR